MSVVQRPVQRPVKQFPERTVRRVLFQSTSLGGGLFSQFGQGFDNGIHLDFANNFHYIKKPGQDPQIDLFTNLFTFTRNSASSTFRDSNGLIQYANENRVLQSETFDVTWSTTRSSITANNVIAPNGALTADTWNEDGSAGSTHNLIQGSVQTAGIVQTISIYVKAINRSFFTIRVNGVSDVTFNLSTGQVGTISAPTLMTAGITSVGNGWYRCSATAIPVDTSFVFYIANADNSIIFNGASQASLALWGAQIQYGNKVGDYLVTTGSAKFDQPRIEYDVNGNALGLLMEGSRQNLCLQSEDQTNAAWIVAGGVTKAGNAVASPDGNVTADSLTLNGGSTVHATYQTFVKAASPLTYTYSVWLKSGAGISQVHLYITSDIITVNGVETIATLTGAGSVTAAGTSGVGWTAVSSSIQAYANGWYRVTLTGTSDSLLVVTAYQYAYASGSNTINSNGSLFYVWGAQLEQAAFASSYIPTTTVAVTRAGDNGIPRTMGAELSQTAGTVICEYDTLSAAAGPNIWQIDDGTNNNFLTNYHSGSVLQGSISTATVSQMLQAVVGVVPDNTLQKAGLSWAANDGIAVRNSVLSAVDNSITLPTVTRMVLGNGNNLGIFGHIRRLEYWPHRMPNDQLQTRTAA